MRLMQGGCWRQVRRKYQRALARWQRYIQIIILVLLFVGGTTSPSIAQLVTGKSSSPATHPEQLIEQGRSLYAADRFADAIKILQQAIAMYRANGDKLQQALTLNNLSLAYLQLGLWQEAQQAVSESLQLLGASKQNIPPANREQLEILAQAWDVQGAVQLARGQAETALTTWQQAADIYQQTGNTAKLTRNRINAAQALQALGLYRQAGKILTQIEQSLRTQANTAVKATGLRSLGNVLRVVGDLERSRQVLLESLAVAKTVRSPTAVAETLFSLGNTVRAQQDFTTALQYYQQAATATKVPIARIQAQLNQLSLLLEIEKYSVAQTLATEIASAIPKLPPSRMSIDAKINFAQSLVRLRKGTKQNSPTWLEMGQLLATTIQQAHNLADQRAESYATGTLGWLYEQSGQLADAEKLTQKALFIAQSINAADIAYQWEWQLGRLSKRKQDISSAIASYTEAYRTLQTLRNDLVAINPNVQFSFRESVEPVYRELVDLLLLSPNQNNLQQARLVIESLQLAELDNFLRQACITTKVDINNIVDRQDPTAAVIYPIILPNRVEVILKLPKQENLRLYTTRIPQNQVETSIAQLVEDIQELKSGDDTHSLFKQMYEWLLQPLDTELQTAQVQTLVFILDGSLRNIPMAALYDGQKYLVEKYNIALSPGLQLFDLERLPHQQLRAITAGLSETPPSVTAISKTSTTAAFPPLPNVKQELQTISTVVRTKLLLNQQFTAQALQQQVKSLPFPVVHLATHGQFSSKADRTFILAWDKQINLNELSQMLRIREEKRSQAIELFVLSACQTAAGDKRAALGLAGVAVRAGARSTIASLWNLNDASTAAMMSQFYQELVKSGVGKAQALRRAQLSLMQQEQYAVPYYWAPYVLIGNWL